MDKIAPEIISERYRPYQKSESGTIIENPIRKFEFIVRPQRKLVKIRAF